MEIHSYADFLFEIARYNFSESEYSETCFGEF